MPALAATTTSEVSPSVSQRADEHKKVFLEAQPFKHLIIDDFFEAGFAEQLLAEFPAFDTALAKSESGSTGGKAVHTNLQGVSPAYRKLYDVISGSVFLELVSRLSGIPDLILDPKMFGGGTHENLHGQELDAHVDFNYDEARQLHRRLNLIVYLNKDWRPEWGGALEIHSNPRRPAENQIRSYEPLFNRCVMFETNEYSWHGFPRITLPEDKRRLSRKSISIYLYTKDRPPEEVAPLHATFYVQRPLPERFMEGYNLTAEDVAELRRLLIRRDQWIDLYQKMELDKNREIAEIEAGARHLRSQIRAPLTGYILQEPNPEGLYGDGWAASRVRLGIRPLQPVSQFILRGFRPEWAPAASATIAVNGSLVCRGPVKGDFEIIATLPRPLSDPLVIEILCDSPPGWAASKGDDRDLAFMLTELRAKHAAM